MNTKIICPECDSTDLSEEIIKDKELEYEYSIDVCGNCGVKGEFSGELMKKNHTEYYSALEKSHRKDLIKIVEDLSLDDFSLLYIENAFDLPKSTISKWQNGGFSPEGYSLMKIIHSFPWIVSVAEKKFSPQSITSGNISRLESLGLKFSIQVGPGKDLNIKFL